MGRKELSPHYPALGQPKGPLTQGAKHTHYWLSPRIFTARWYSQRTLSTAIVQNLGVRSCHGKSIRPPLSHTCAVINPNMEVYFGCIFTTQRQQCRERSPLCQNQWRNLLIHFCYNRPEFIWPNILQGLVFQALWGFKVQLTLHTLTRENFLKHRFLPSILFFQIVSRLIFLKHILIYLDKHIYSCYYAWVIATYLGMVSNQGRKVPVFVKRKRTTLIK